MTVSNGSTGRPGSGPAGARRLDPARSERHDGAANGTAERPRHARARRADRDTDRRAWRGADRGDQPRPTPAQPTGRGAPAATGRPQQPRPTRGPSSSRASVPAPVTSWAPKGRAAGSDRPARQHARPPVSRCRRVQSRRAARDASAGPERGRRAQRSRLGSDGANGRFPAAARPGRAGLGSPAAAWDRRQSWRERLGLAKKPADAASEAAVSSGRRPGLGRCGRCSFWRHAPGTRRRVPPAPARPAACRCGRDLADRRPTAFAGLGTYVEPADRRSSAYCRSSGDIDGPRTAAQPTHDEPGADVAGARSVSRRRHRCSDPRPGDRRPPSAGAARRRCTAPRAPLTSPDRRPAAAVATRRSLRAAGAATAGCRCRRLRRRQLPGRPRSAPIGAWRPPSPRPASPGVPGRPGCGCPGWTPGR